MSDYLPISPKFRMELIQKISKAIWKQYPKYALVQIFIEQFQIEEHDERGNFSGRNFDIDTQDGHISLEKTLSNMPQDVLFSVAIECGVSVPIIVPAFPTFKRKLTQWEDGSSLLLENFTKAYNSVYKDPDLAISLANSTLESIIKHILKSGKFPNISYNKNDTLYELTEKLLKGLEFFPTKTLQKNIRNIGSSLLKLSKEIEELRSDATFSHGKAKNDYIVDSSLYSVLVVNSIITIGLFLLSFFEEKYANLRICQSQEDVEDLPF